MILNFLKLLLLPLHVNVYSFNAITTINHTSSEQTLHSVPGQYIVSYTGSNCRKTETELFSSTSLTISLFFPTGTNSRINNEPTHGHIPDDGSKYISTDNSFEVWTNTNSSGTTYFFNFHFIKETQYSFSITGDVVANNYSFSINMIEKNQDIVVRTVSNNKELEKQYSTIDNSTTVYETYHSNSPLKIVLNNSNIASLNVFQTNDYFTKGNVVDSTTWENSLSVGKYIVEVINKAGDVENIILEIGETGQPSHFTEFWTSEKGKDIYSRANYHDPNLYNEEFIQTADQDEINKMVQDCTTFNWPLPPVNSSNIGIILGATIGGVAVVGASTFGGIVLNKKSKAKKKAAQEEIKRKLREEHKVA